MASKKETALTERNSYGQLADVNMAAMMAEELDGLDAGFERIKIPWSGNPGAFPVLTTSCPNAVQHMSVPRSIWLQSPQ